MAGAERRSPADRHEARLHVLGCAHPRLPSRHHGRDERLTDVYDPRLLRPLLA